ncbi:uncharacterized protein MELLADRAFT_104162 [Melampsora larici-populina 98AG31]|uniref:Uncharacterized protein n=1 Tax=Melampsora larici-populina (strain 98AG31 / pathotype 3-4-7) TaxID=747676 RepID=F4RDS7_MELLP|nr:uncharacterized protein MELLADRAFT_104162 [Melampsora larici-populina 98AG31]EGG09453.1 hypothetical protein MELLADRAFT_104162 [Melampsora larici-populina 98AG31]
MPPSPELDKVLVDLCHQGLTRVQMLEYLNTETKHTMKLRTLAQHLQHLNLSTMQAQLTEGKKEKCLQLMKFYHTRRWQQKEVEAAEKLLQRKQAGDKNAGFQQMAHVMATAESIRWYTEDLDINSVWTLFQELLWVVIPMELDLDDIKAGGDPQELYPMVDLNDEDESEMENGTGLSDDEFYYEDEFVDEDAPDADEEYFYDSE